MVNIKLSFSVLIPLIFLGCNAQPTALIRLEKIEPIMFAWEDIIHKSVKGHFITQNMWQTIQEELINRRINANKCTDINNFNLK